ncbi:NTP transferase domain-containing protein [Cryomorpha ignava]|uniref:Probable molybdenum cofactor guanylyltransferase n=1 Tax=Cryomorpha ignava TaxID=101383 RepID=A0A7K3WSS8_9FLAO|nr:NTP transferase domain-containing protein [Cryomorpha ignava]NEN24588.1 NTP transferase domain-containing protein [Cryomorpha ignava]
MSLEIFIYADKVGRGKTTALKNWLLNQKGIGGVLSPKIDGKRFFEFIDSNDFLEMESGEASLQIGKYNFNVDHFLRAEEHLWSDWQNPNIHTLIIDEIGPLEIKKNQGFHQLLIRILKSEIAQAKKLILVVRDYCLQDFFSKYSLDNAKIITEIDLLKSSFQRPVGIVLCGGNSSRMQTDKALLNYHSMPQWQYVYNMLLPFCENVYLSLNANQVAEYSLPKTVGFIEDLPRYFDHGPITGVMSVLDSVDDRPLFILACDYPLLRMEHLLTLFKNRKSDNDLVCYRNDSFPEPLISIFEKVALKELTSYFSEGKDSLAKFIQQIKTTYIDVSNPDFLQNVNSPEEFEMLKNELSND